MSNFSHRRTAGTLGIMSGLLLLVSACSSNEPASADEEEYPEESITLIVQAAAGGGSDMTARALSAELEEILDTDIIVENRTGGSGSTALNYVAGEDPDGYTLGYMPVELAMFQHMGYDIDPEDYDLISQVVNVPGIVAVPGDSPYETVEDLVAASESEPLSIANSGTGGIFETAAKALEEETGANFDHVPFDGDAPAVTAALGSQVDAVVAGAPAALGAMDEDNMRILMVFGSEDIGEMEDVPTSDELGYDLEFGGWGGIGAPDGVPEHVTETLEQAIDEAVETEGFESTIDSMNSQVVHRQSDEFTQFVDEQTAAFEDLLE